MKTLSVHTRRAAAALVVFSILASGCASSPGVEKGTPPNGLPSFYAVPTPLPSTKPGTLIKYQLFKTSKIDGTTYQVMYVSENTQGAPIAVTGIVMVPNSPPPTGGYRVISWGHGTNGMAPQCAPSLKPITAVPFQNRLLEKGYEVVASDYQGEGTPGPLPYLVGSLAAKNTIDIVRAADNMSVAHASKTYAVWGHSEGGQTAMFALHLALTYAPTLHLVGVVAGAPPSQFNYVYTFLKTSPYRYYLLMAAEGFNAGYGNKAAPLSAVMDKSAMKLLPILLKGCGTYLQNTLDAYKIQGMVKGNPFSNPKWKKLIAENDPANFAKSTPVPLLIPQGGTDEQIPVGSTKALFTDMCKIGQDTERWIYPGKSHSGVIQFYMGDMLRWLTDRFENKPGPDPLKPDGLPNVSITVCPK